MKPVHCPLYCWTCSRGIALDEFTYTCYCCREKNCGRCIRTGNSYPFSPETRNHCIAVAGRGVCVECLREVCDP